MLMKYISAMAMFAIMTCSHIAHAETLGSTKGSANAQTAGALAKTMWRAGIKLTPIPHAGTQQYLEKVDMGEIDFGLSNPSVFNWGYNGIRTAKKAHRNLRFVANLQFFRTGFGVRNDSDIWSIDDLRGKKVPVNFQSAPGFHYLSIYKLLNANPPLTLKDVIPVPVASLPGNWKAFNKGRVDVTIMAVGSGHAKKLNATTPSGIRMLSFNGGAGEKRMLEGWPGFSIIMIDPSPSTPSIRRPTRVLNFPYMLWTNKDVSDDVVRKIVIALFENYKTFQKASKVVSSFDRLKMAAFTGGVPMHPGATEAYKALGLIK
jgi:hypothetical protein